MKRILLCIFSIGQLLSFSFGQLPVFEREFVNDPALAEHLKNFKHQYSDFDRLKSASEDFGDAPKVNWVKKIGNSASDRIWDIIGDSEGNFYICGEYSGKLDFFGEDLNILFRIDGYIAKFSPEGNLLWHKQLKGKNPGSFITASDLTIDENDNIFLTGSFNSNEFETDGFTLSTYDTRDIFLMKINKDGNVQWAQSYGSGSAGEIKYLANKLYLTSGSMLYCIDNSGNLMWQNYYYGLRTFAVTSSNVYVVGSFRDTYDLGNGFIVSTQNYSYGTYFAKLDLSGNMMDVKDFESPNPSTYFRSMTVLPNNEIILSGYFIGEMVLDLFTISPELQDNSTHAFILNFDENLNEQWYKFTPEGNTSFYDLAIDGTSIYFTGYYTGRISWDDSNLEGGDYFLLEMDMNGNVINLNNLDYYCHQMALCGSKLINVGNDNNNIRVYSSSTSGSLEWSLSTTGNFGQANIWYTFDIDDNKDIYLQGMYVGKFSLEGTEYEGDGVYITKLGPDGRAKWVKNLDSPTAYGSGIEADKNGNVFASGSFSGELNSSGGNFKNDIGESLYLVKFDKDGAMKFIKEFKGTGTVIGIGGQAIDKDGNILITGVFTNTLTFGNTFIESTSGTQGFLAKFSNNGEVLWVKHLQNNGAVWSRSVDCDANNNVYLTGGFNSDNIVMDEVELVADSVFYYENYYKSLYTGFLLKFNPDGTAIWGKTFGNGSYYTRGHNIAVSDGGDAYISGLMWNSYDVDNLIKFGSIEIEGNLENYSDMFVAKYNTNGQEQWAKLLEISNDSWPMYKISLDDQENVYVGGNFLGSLLLEDVISTNSYNGSEDHFLVKYSKTGNFDWLKTIEIRDQSGFTGLFASEAAGVDQILIGGRISNNLSKFGPFEVVGTSENAFLAYIGNKDLVGINSRIETRGFASVYPNPGRGDFIVEVNESAELFVFSQTGQLVAREFLKFGKNNIHLRNLVKGVYFFQIKEKDFSHVEKIIIY